MSLVESAAFDTDGVKAGIVVSAAASKSLSRSLMLASWTSYSLADDIALARDPFTRNGSGVCGLSSHFASEVQRSGQLRLVDSQRGVEIESDTVNWTVVDLAWKCRKDRRSGGKVRRQWSCTHLEGFSI